MPEEEKITDVQGKVDELMKAKDEPAKTDTETKSLIEEARDLKDELLKLKEEMRTEREKLDNIHAQAILGGKSIQGESVDKTDQEKAEERAKSILGVYGK